MAVWINSVPFNHPMTYSHRMINGQNASEKLYLIQRLHLLIRFYRFDGVTAPSTKTAVVRAGMLKVPVAIS